MSYEESKETIEKLLLSAKKEFIEKGYMKASLRNICRDAGVTTGALYFFFQDKEDLYAKVVGKPLMELQTVLKSHMLEEISELKDYVPGRPVDIEEDMEAAAKIVKLLFKYKDEYELLITKSQGSRFENIVDETADELNKHYVELFAGMKGYSSKRQMTAEDKFAVHFMAHDQVDIFIHLLTHCRDEKEALRQLKGMFAYIIGGWFGVLNNS